MNMLFTRWLYPISEPIPLLETPSFYLDNPRGDEIDKVAELLHDQYHQLRGIFPPKAGPEYISLDWIIRQFRDRFGPTDPCVTRALKGHRAGRVFTSLAKLWIVGRYDELPVVPKEPPTIDQIRKAKTIATLLDDNDTPAERNCSLLRNYFALLGLLIPDPSDAYARTALLLNSDMHQILANEFDDNLFRHAIIMFMVFATTDRHRAQSDKSSWQGFPYARERLVDIRDLLSKRLDSEHRGLLMYIGQILRIVQHDTNDTSVQFILLISLLELLLTHSPDSARFNVEESINRQFRLKTAIIVHREDPSVSLDELGKRLKQLYGLRSAIAHGDFKAVDKYKSDLSRKKKHKEYYDTIVSDASRYLRASLEQFLKDPQYVMFLKKS